MLKKSLTLIAFSLFIVGISIGSYYLGEKHGLSLRNSRETTLEKSTFPPTLKEMVARDAKRKQDLRIVQQALESYYEKYGRVPYLLADSTNSLWRRNLKEELKEYLKEIPIDPINNEVYHYSYDGSLDGGKSYVLSAVLENPTDPEGPSYVIYGGHRWPAIEK
jgi:hypothetical protein